MSVGRCLTVALFRPGKGSCDSLNLASPSLARLGSGAPHSCHPWPVRRPRRSLQLPLPGLAGHHSQRVAFASSAGESECWWVFEQFRACAGKLVDPLHDRRVR